MTLSDTIRRAALGPALPTLSFGSRECVSAMATCRFQTWHEFIEWFLAPEEVQRMFLCFVAESCE